MNLDNSTFERVMVDNLVAGGTRVYWEMNRNFNDPGTYNFQLQVGHTGLTYADDWTNVGSTVVNGYMTFDSTRRVFGKTLDTHYRVRLITDNGTYYSQPASCSGNLVKKDWLIAREIVRKELLRHSALTSPIGYLLKVRRYGPQCQSCINKLTGEVTKANCTQCYGTGYEFGYFNPLSAYYADVSSLSTRTHVDGNRGTVEEHTISARFIGDPQLYSYDVWVNGTSDLRYYIHSVKSIAQVRGVNIIYDAELRQAPFTDIIYRFPVVCNSCDTCDPCAGPQNVFAGGST